MILDKETAGAGTPAATESLKRDHGSTKRSWVKVWRKMPHCRTIRRSPVAVRWLWVVLLTLPDHLDGLLIADGIALSSEDIADEAALPIADVVAGLSTLTNAGMLSEDQNGTLRIANFNHFQETPGAARTRRWRSRKRDVTCDVSRDVSSDADVTTEAEAEAEAEADPLFLSKTPSDPPVEPTAKKAISPKKQLLDHYHAEFVRCRDQKPVISGAKDTRTLAQLLGGRSLDDAKQIVTEFMEAPPDWYGNRGLFEPEHIVSAANQILSRRATSAKKKDKHGWDREASDGTR